MEPTTADSSQSAHQFELGYSLLLGLGLGMVAVFMLATIIDHIEIGAASVHWPMTRGTVVRSGIVENDGDYGASISYEYRVGGTSYRGERVQWSDRSQETAETSAQRNPLGTGLSVYYDPAKPGQSVVQQGIEPELWYAVPTVAFLSFGAGAGIWGWLRSRREAEHAQSAAPQ